MYFVDNKDGYGSPSFTLGVTAQSRDLGIARGVVLGCKPMAAYGERVATGAETNAPIWNAGNFSLLPAAGVQLSIVSTSVNDVNITGSGVWKVDIHYLDNNLVEQNETVNMNGTNPVLTVATNIRFVQRMHIESGSPVANGVTAIGTITASYSAIVQAQIDAGRTSNNSSFRMVPAGYNLRVAGFVAGSASSTAAAISVIRPRANYIMGEVYSNPLIFFTLSEYALSNSSVAVDLPPQTMFPPGCVIGAVHTTDKAAAITYSWYGYLEKIDA